MIHASASSWIPIEIKDDNVSVSSDNDYLSRLHTTECRRVLSFDELSRSSSNICIDMDSKVVDQNYSMAVTRKNFIGCVASSDSCNLAYNSTGNHQIAENVEPTASCSNEVQVTSCNFFTELSTMGDNPHEISSATKVNGYVTSCNNEVPYSSSVFAGESPTNEIDRNDEYNIFSVDDLSDDDEVIPETDSEMECEDLQGGFQVVDDVSATVVPSQLGATETPIKTRRPTMETNFNRKARRNTGKSYTTRSGKFKPAKTFKYIHCGIYCKKDCKKLSYSDRMMIFRNFWKIGSWQTQSHYIATCVTLHTPKKSKINSRIKHLREFKLNDVKICQKVFLTTLGISNKRLDYCVNKKTVAEMVSPDKRGRNRDAHLNNGNSAAILSFLETFPKYSSHYSNSEKVYLTKDEIFRMYTDHIGHANAVSKTTFMKEFKKYNVGIYIPKSDTCKFCDEINTRIKSAAPDSDIDELRKEHQTHLERYQTIKLEFEAATTESRMDDRVLCFTFDMQQTQPLPKLNTSVVFYKRQLWIYNLGVHTMHDNGGTMMVWTEGTGKRGANEICSSLLAFLQSIDLSTITNIKTFSDGCIGQNKNKAIIAFFMFICNELNVESWEHTYMVSGHSYLPNDRDFGLIGKCAKRRTTIYSVDEWVDVIHNSRKKKPFQVIRMEGKFKKMDQLTKNRKYVPKSTTGDNIFSFPKLTWFKVKKDSDLVQFRQGCDLIETWEFPRIEETTELPDQEGSCHISKEKYDDLMSLLNLIPPDYHNFFKNLSY